MHILMPKTPDVGITLRHLREGDRPVLQIVTAARIIQRFARYRYYVHSYVQDNTSSANSRLYLVKLFVYFYERKYREPVVNATAQVRNEAFRDYCARMILYRYRLYAARQKYYFRVYPVYKAAALTIYRAFIAAPVSRNDHIFIIKTRRIQRVLRGILYRRKFHQLKGAIARLSDAKITDPLQLLKLLSIADYNIINSFYTPFSLRLRLGAQNLMYWPPKIYWKVFLSTNVTDVATTAPRNYAIESETGVVDRKLWYIRVTNAQWRPLEGGADLVSERSRFVPRPCATRKQVQEAKARRYVAWYRRMREEHLLQQIGAAFGASADEAYLTQWGESLDYMTYAEQWLEMCVSKYQKPMLDEDTSQQIAELKRALDAPDLNSIDLDFKPQNTRSSFASCCSDEENEGFKAEISDLVQIEHNAQQGE